MPDEAKDILLVRDGFDVVILPADVDLHEVAELAGKTDNLYAVATSGVVPFTMEYLPMVWHTARYARDRCVPFYIWGTNLLTRWSFAGVVGTPLPVPMSQCAKPQTLDVLDHASWLEYAAINSLPF